MSVPTSQSPRASHAVPACASAGETFQHPLLEEPPTASAPAATRHQYAELAAAAAGVCATCPLLRSCLYAAVVDHDVAGYVAGTTAKERVAIRRRLGVTVDPEDLDTLAGVTAANRQVDHDEVLRLRKANPTESLETIARRLGCSLSTVKRHLRRSRADATVAAPVRSVQARPDQQQVIAALAGLRGVSAPAARRSLVSHAA